MIISFIHYILLLCLSFNNIFHFQKDCNKMIELFWFGEAGEFYQSIEKYIGFYHQTERKHHDHYIYQKVEHGIVTANLFYKRGCGWRVNNDYSLEIMRLNVRLIIFCT